MLETLKTAECVVLDDVASPELLKTLCDRKALWENKNQNYQAAVGAGWPEELYELLARAAGLYPAHTLAQSRLPSHVSLVAKNHEYRTGGRNQRARTWHSDAGPSGVGILYFCPWRLSWGGSLLVAGGANAIDDILTGRDKTSEDRSGALHDEVDIMTVIHPMPGRLVLLAPGVWHCVDWIKPEAGWRVALAVAF